MKITCIITTFAFVLANTASAATLPVGTAIYGELEETVTSKKKDTSVGEILRAHVWRDVLVDNRVYIKAGTPMVVRVSEVQHARVAGRKGDLELEAVSTNAVDGTEVLLDGGYDKSGKSRMAAAIVLFALVSWPLIFIKGKQATLQAGTVFDARVQSDVEVAFDSSAPPRIDLKSNMGLTAEVLYDEAPEDKESTLLPIALTNCDGKIEAPTIVTVNDQQIDAVPLEDISVETDAKCSKARGMIDLKALSKHFQKGINRFEIETSGLRTEVILDVEV